jgi:hypothetical protein
VWYNDVKRGVFMSKKGIEAAAKKLEEYYARFPDWYWKYGLHDAVILSVSELQLVPDYKVKKPKFNCLEIELDSKNALHERDIKTIRLYNYKIKTLDVDINSIDKPWWMGDTIKELNNKQYSLDIEIESARGSRKHFIVEFEIPEIERK